MPDRRDRVVCLAVTLAYVGLWAVWERTDPPAPSLLLILPQCLTVLFFRRAPVAAAVAWAVIVVAGGAEWESMVIPAVLLLAFGCGAYLNLRPGMAAAAVLLAGHLAADPRYVVPALLSVIPAYWVGVEMRRRNRLVRELEQRTRELEAEQEAFTRLSVRHERARIARELHDIVSHNLAVMIVQAGAGRLADEHDPERLASIRAAGDQALAEMARLVDILHEGDRSIEALVEGSGVDVHTSVDEVPEALRDVAYRVVQEGLTNALKHAPGARVDVRVAAGDAVEVEVRNGAATGDHSIGGTGSGMGLDGLRLRVEELGGELTAGPDGDGWALRARLPSPASASATAQPAALPAAS